MEDPARTTSESIRISAIRAHLVLAFSVLFWLAGFAALERYGTWAPFAVLGPLLATLVLASTSPPSRERTALFLLRPSFLSIAVGVAAGTAMALFTHVAFSLLTWISPAGSSATKPFAGALSEVRRATVHLYTLLNVGGFSPMTRAALIVVVAASEEIIFRGRTLAVTSGQGLLGRGDRPALLRVVTLAAIYALSMATLGSGLLILCAFVCGLVWGGLRVTTGSLVAPIVAHVIWDLGVLVFWPLVRV